MLAPIEVKADGKRRKLSKQRIAVRQLVNQTVAGNLKAFALLFELLSRHGHFGGSRADAPILDERDVAAFDRFSAFLGHASAQGSDPVADIERNVNREGRDVES